MKEKIFVSIIFILTFVLLLFSIKGQKGDPFYFQREKDISIGGPYELSSSTSRYALVEAIVQNKTFFLNTDLAKFASPDVVRYKGNFFSIFTPGVSFIGVPFYIIGSALNIPQLSTYFSVLLAGFINAILIAKIARKIGSSIYVAIASGLLFLFATNALTYTLSFTQHQFSTMIILLSLLITFRKKSYLNNIIFGVLAGIGALLDIPNVILLVPIGIYLLSKNVDLMQTKETLKINVKISIIWVIISVLPFLGLFFFYNIKTTGSFTKLGQTIGRTDFFQYSTSKQNQITKPKQADNSFKGLNLPFETRNQMTGFYILLLSNERSWLYYSPIVLVGLIGYWLAFKDREKRSFAVVALAVVSTDIVVYSMFGDPWGGWAFGPRYLIPAAAILTSGIGLVLDRFKKNIYAIVSILIIAIYSVYVSLLGALTSSAIPPKIEAHNLPIKIPYTYLYNQQLLNKNFTSSLVYNLFLWDKISAEEFYYIFFALTIGLIGLVISGMYFTKNKS